MSTLFNVLFAWKASSTHHKLALDALRQLRGPDAEGWRDCFLSQADPYLRGAKVPDTEFKDFCNHVLHVRDNFWGGAVAACNAWYARTVAALGHRDWADAAYSAGVLSHYFTDPLMPFHTGQTEAEGSVHRALEWSVTKSYESLRTLMEQELGGWPTVDVPAGPDWLARMVRDGATRSNTHYDTLIERYNLAAGVKDPPAGLDGECRACLAPLLGVAAVGFARVLERAFADANVTPPRVSLALPTLLATLNVPVQFVAKKLADAKERAVVTAIYAELQATGKVIKALPEDDRVVRARHAEEVLRIPLAELDAQPIKPKADPKPVAVLPFSRAFLRPDMIVAEAPSIGPKTAERLNQIGVQTVADLLALDPADAAKRLNARHIPAATVADWQSQARLMCEVAGLRGHDAQFLVGAGVRHRDQLAKCHPSELLTNVESYLATSAGERVLRGGKRPDLAEVTEWVQAAQSPGERRAA